MAAQLIGTKGRRAACRSRRVFLQTCRASFVQQVVCRKKACRVFTADLGLPVFRTGVPCVACRDRCVRTCGSCGTEHGQRHTQLSHGTQTASKVNTASERDSGRPQERRDYSGQPQITSEKDSEHSEKKRDYLVITFASTECTENRSPDDSTGIKLQKILFLFCLY